MKISGILARSVIVLSGTVLLFVVYYCIFASVFSTDEEKALEEENARYSKALPALEEDVDLLDAELEFLKSRDARIYRKIFKVGIPSVPDWPEHRDISEVMRSASQIEEDWRAIYRIVNSRRHPSMPLIAPIDNLEYTNVGASVGEKMNPFYKMPVMHDGVDLVAPPLTPVHAVAPGTVTAVKKITGGKGIVVEISHSDGYVSRYAHLQSALVKQRKRVSRGDVIGLVGDSGRAFSTHLHYELEKDGKMMDPVYWFFGQADPQLYYNMLVMSTISRQSMD